ncbi:hypothetical protein BAUCODRAFT_103474 [Baudoinia panamericana UAMH 10762]|uniref:Saccharopine dehydrogenase NADP binding domain-containing protein n=1 Tax=Baudoinia panamericana (strain UAMH 10762) TaxID=717646 RepID=M2LW64_BAUPA|nr:uncharacterized protein BAUCODRAFT_103474 [Baudoinia panamericana UAMH 10762]EMC98907.1 hypothetical protein BAUCODRAFT_103474 [Baudoinia panamericana UAMH 10762]
MDHQSTQQYECIVFGATGYTGRYTCEHIQSSLPTDFRWAVAGRSETKLQRLVADLKHLNPDRPPPAIETASLEKDNLVALANKTKVLITTVGPYHKYGEVVIEACATTGTHYLDVTGEIPWVYDMIQKYSSVARQTGAIIIPQNGVESAPSDLMAWSLVTHVRQALNVGVAELVQTTWELNAVPSGGTLATVLTLFDSYSLNHLAKTGNPWSMSPVQPSALQMRSRPLIERITGVRDIPDLGTLTDSLQGPSDTPIVHRSWGLHDKGKLYGSKFQFNAYQRIGNALYGFGIHLAMALGLLALAVPPVRWLLMLFVYQPGEGPSKEASKHDCIEWRAIAYADTSDPNDPRRAMCRMRFEGSMYALTGICVAEAAITIARDKTLAHQLGGGFLTPATLGAPYLDRLKKAGVKTEVRMMP